MNTRRIELGVKRAALAACALVAVVAKADTVRWVNAGGGVFEDNGNWDRGSPPGSGDLAVFDLVGTYTVTVGAGRTVGGLLFSRGSVTLDLSGNSVVVGVPFMGQGFQVAPATGVAACTAKVRTGQIPLSTAITVQNGGTLVVEGTLISDLLPGGNGSSWSTFNQGANLTVSGGTINCVQVVISGASVLVENGGYLTGDPLQCTQPSSITARGANSRIRGEAGVSFRGTLNLLDGAVAYSLTPSASSVLLFGCQARIEGNGSSIAPLTMDAASSIIAKDGGSVGNGTNPVGSVFHGIATIGPGGFLRTGGTFNQPLRLDHSATVEVGYIELPQGLIVNLDGLNTRTTPLLSPSQFFNIIAGPLVVNVRNSHAMQVGRVIPIFQYVAPTGGSFSSLVAPPLPGGRMFTLSQPLGGLTTLNVVAGGDPCWTADFNGDEDFGTDADIEAFFACLAGNCCATCPPSADFNGDGDVGTDSDIEAFFRVLAGGAC